MRWRKQLGILCFWFIFLHWILLEIANFQANMPSLILHPNLFIWMGVIGLIALFIGYITSNIFSIKLLKGNWKLVQQIAYLAFIGAGIHIFLLKQDWSILILLLIYSVLKFFEWKKKAPLIPVSTPVSKDIPNRTHQDPIPLT
jgi:DMSO/TMAO reductase YedYZ heme-binding membrane subunit